MTPLKERFQRGYTAVELMLALGLFGVGVSGIIAMQKLTVVSNQHAKNLAVATHVAQAWLDQLAADATLWTGQQATNTSWVKLSEGSTDGVWQLPARDSDRDFGPAFDALGAPLPADDADGARFCAHVRLTTLYPASGAPVAGGRQTLAGNGLARAEVRVFWLRDGATPVAGACTDQDQVQTVGAATSSYHQVYKVTAVRQHSILK